MNDNFDNSHDDIVALKKYTIQKWHDNALLWYGGKIPIKNNWRQIYVARIKKFFSKRFNQLSQFYKRSF